MLTWIRRMLKEKIVGSAGNDPEVPQRERIRVVFHDDWDISAGGDSEALQRERVRIILQNNPDIPAPMKMLAKDFDERIVKQDRRGSASSPISS